MFIFTFLPLFIKFFLKTDAIKGSFSFSFFINGIPVPPALKPIIGSLILLSHNFLNLSASVSFFVNLLGIGEMILFFRKAFTNLSEIFSVSVFVI